MVRERGVRDGKEPVTRMTMRRFWWMGALNFYFFSRSEYKRSWRKILGEGVPSGIQDRYPNDGDGLSG